MNIRVVGVIVVIFTILFVGGNAESQQTLLRHSRPMDVFLIGGQSNALGEGFTGGTIPVPPRGTAFQYFDGRFSRATDFGSSRASAWPEFAITFHQATDRPLLFVPTAVSGTCQTQACDSSGADNWDSTGKLFGNSVTQLNGAIAEVRRRGYQPSFRGVLWMQGEADALAINKGDTTAKAYKRALVRMITHYRSLYGRQMPFYIFRIGTQPGSSDLGFAQIRRAEEVVAKKDPYTKIVWRGALNYPARGLISPDPFRVHFTINGYNEMGRIGASNIIKEYSRSLPRDAKSAVIPPP